MLRTLTHKPTTRTATYATGTERLGGPGQRGLPALPRPLEHCSFYFTSLQVNPRPIKPQAACGWAGLASVGCGGPTCSVYIQGNSANDLDVIMHELGHTQGLSHSGKGWDEVRAVGWGGVG